MTLEIRSHKHTYDVGTIVAALEASTDGMSLEEMFAQLPVSPDRLTQALDAGVSARDIVFTSGILDGPSMKSDGLRFHKAPVGLSGTRADPEVIKNIFRDCETDMGRGDRDAMRQVKGLLNALLARGHAMPAIEKALLELVDEQVLHLRTRADGYMIFWIAPVVAYTVIALDLISKDIHFFHVRAGSELVARDKAMHSEASRSGCLTVVAVSPGRVPFNNARGKPVYIDSL